VTLDPLAAVKQAAQHAHGGIDADSQTISLPLTLKMAANQVTI
jgi:hypothetical protein